MSIEIWTRYILLFRLYLYRHKLEQNEWQIEIYQSEWLIKIKSNKRVQNWTISLFQHIITRFIYINWLDRCEGDVLPRGCSLEKTKLTRQGKISTSTSKFNDLDLAIKRGKGRSTCALNARPCNYIIPCCYIPLTNCPGRKLREGRGPVPEFRAGFLVVVALSRTCACSWTRKHLQGEDYAREFGRAPLSTRLLRRYTRRQTRHPRRREIISRGWKWIFNRITTLYSFAIHFPFSRRRVIVIVILWYNFSFVEINESKGEEDQKDKSTSKIIGVLNSLRSISVIFQIKDRHRCNNQTCL